MLIVLPAGSTCSICYMIAVLSVTGKNIWKQGLTAQPALLWMVHAANVAHLLDTYRTTCCCWTTGRTGVRDALQAVTLTQEC